MAVVINRQTSHQYQGTDGEAFAGLFSNVSFVSEAQGVLTLEWLDAGAIQFSIPAGSWVVANAYAQIGPGSLTDAEYQEQYKEIA